jgi:hypothetical protein|tara:strand:- start:15 stop:245 length:231 start_codon:yes stop_codon:yes gene_type:complete
MAKNKAVQGEADGFIKRTFNAVKAWIVGNGIEGFLGLIIGLALWPLGFKIYAGFAFGIFASRNWDLLKVWVRGLVK